MKNNSVSYFFTQRDRQTDPPTAAAAAATTVRPLSEALRQAHTRGVVGPGSEEGFSPFFLPCQPMLLLGEGLTWADPSSWFSPVTSIELAVMFGEVLGSGVKDPMTHPKDMSLCLALSTT